MGITLTQPSTSFIRPASHGFTEDLIEVDDKRPLLQRIKSVVEAFFKFVSYLFNKVIKILKSRPPLHGVDHIYLKLDENMKYDQNQVPWNHQPENSKQTNEGLLLFVHGLQSSPYVWKRYITEVHKTYPNMYCLAPHIPFEGDCDLALAAQPILELVQDYADKHPEKPIVLVGTSNGARINMYMETKLTSSIPRKLLVASIAGVHYGTKQLNFLVKWNLLWVKKFHSKIVSDFHWGSQKAQECLSAWQKKQVEWKEMDVKAHHFFCASKDDEQVRPLSVSLPQSISKATYKIFTGENHISIVPAARKDILEWIANNLVL